MPGDHPEPTEADAVALFHAGRTAEAEHAFAALLARGERGFDTLYLMGILAAGRQDPAAAERWLAEATATRPAQPEALHNHGMILRRLGRPADALARYDAALSVAPAYAEAHASRANLLNDLRRWAEALDSADRALALSPQLPAAANARGNALVGLGRSREALDSYRRASALAPAYADPLVNLGNTLLALGAARPALESYDGALRIAPGLGAAWSGRGNALSALQRWAEAAAAYDRAWALDPRLPFLAGQRLHARMKVCDWSGFDANVAVVREGLGAGRPACVPFPLLALPSTADEQQACARIFTAAMHGPAAPAPAQGAGPPIRIAYVSADFHDHATAYLLAELVELHDRARVEVTGISIGPHRDDVMRRRLQAGFDRFFEVSGLDDTAVVELVRSLGIDIAIDLKGYTTGARPGIFQARCAPLQVSYMGFPGTMGADFIDYLVADPVLIPEARRSAYAEKIANVRHCYQPNDRHRPRPPLTTRREDHGLPAEGFVFGCFNNTYKILPDTFAAWMRVLAQVDRSVLWLFADNPSAAANLRQAAAGHGVDPARLVFAGFQPLAGHLERHGHMDLFLDTAPYTAHTTASDALWMDTPLITCPGETFASRVAASLLTAAGVPDLIAATPGDYEALALTLARDPERLGALRTRLAANRPESPLFDTPSLCGDLEGLYEAMQARHAAGLTPDHIGPA